jgi:hypothetical protein
MSRLYSRLAAVTLGVLALGVGSTQAASASTDSAGGTALTSVSAAEPTAAAAEERNEQCRNHPLPWQVLGTPVVQAGATSGVRVWHDGYGWHLRATHPGTWTETFTGTVRSPGAITASGYRLEKQDALWVGPDRHLMTFRLVNHGGVDGIDFTDSCSLRTGFSFQRDGHELNTGRVWLGGHAVHPTSDPFAVDRKH